MLAIVGMDVLDGCHWKITSPIDVDMPAEKVAARFAQKAPEGWKGIQMNTPLKVAIFKRFLIEKDKNGGPRLDKKTVELFGDSRTAMDKQLKRYEKYLLNEPGELHLTDRNILSIQSLWAYFSEEAEEQLSTSLECPICMRRSSGENPDIPTYNRVVKALEEKWEKLLNGRRVVWIKNGRKTTRKSVGR